MQPKKSTVFPPTCANAAALGEERGFEVNHRGIVAAGFPIGDHDFVAEEAMMSARSTVAHATIIGGQIRKYARCSLF
jgi:hypothetical protein